MPVTAVIFGLSSTGASVRCRLPNAKLPRRTRSSRQPTTYDGGLFFAAARAGAARSLAALGAFCALGALATLMGVAAAGAAATGRLSARSFRLRLGPFDLDGVATAADHREAERARCHSDQSLPKVCVHVIPCLRMPCFCARAPVDDRCDPFLPPHEVASATLTDPDPEGNWEVTRLV